MVPVLCRPGRCATQVEKSPCLNCATQFLTVAYDGVCSPNVSIRMAWISLGGLPCRERKNNLMIAHLSMLLKSRASPNMIPFSLCKKNRLAIRHINRPVFPTTLSIPSYDIGKYVGLRTYQYPLLFYGSHCATSKLTLSCFHIFYRLLQTSISICNVQLQLIFSLYTIHESK